MERPTGSTGHFRLPSSSRPKTSRTSAKPARPSTEHGHVQPASPEVISSLILSLSAISTPAQSHFDNLPTIDPNKAPPSPGVRQTEFVRDEPQPPPASAGFGMDYGAYRTPVEDNEQDFLHPAYAPAESPVVGMARSPRSPRSAAMSRRSSRSLPDDAALLRRSASRASFASSKVGRDDVSGFGVVSLEPGPRMSSISVASTGSAGRRSLIGTFGLLKRSSRDLSKDREGDSIHLGDSLRLNSSRSRQSLRSSPSMEATGANGAQLLEKPTFPVSRHESVPNSPPTDASNFSPGGIGSGRVIPTRESSLRHTHRRASSGKRKSVRHSTYSSRDFTIEDGITEAKVEDDGVSKRINELKVQQKKIRDEMLCDDGVHTMPKGMPLASHELLPSNQSSQPPAPAGSAQSGRVGLSLKEVDELREADIEESAPSPTVSTRRALTNDKRNFSPLNSKTGSVYGSLDRSDSYKQRGMKRLSNPPTSADTKHHRRTLSGTRPPPVRRTSSIPDERPSSADSIDHAVETYLCSPRLTQKVPHPVSDRIIAFSEVGDPNGHVVFCCVGMGLTRYLTAFYDELARTLKLRLITPDRPGVGESDPCTDGTGTPLGWPDDLAIICNHLKITKFSLLAHSAGAIYALATALRMPQHIRGRIHLLAPWIPPSQMSGMGSHKEPLPASALPYSQRILRAIPTSFLKVANSSFMTATSASITSSLPKTRRNKRSVITRDVPVTKSPKEGNPPLSVRRNSINGITEEIVSQAAADPSNPKAQSAIIAAAVKVERQRQSDYDNRLTHAIWELATTNANPAVDLLICLERRQTIGFRYVDINRSVVIHHGSRDTRVPVDNVRWLGKTMRRCEVRVLEGEGHGLMASATVMSNVLMEIAKEWEDWTTVTQGRSGARRTTFSQRQPIFSAS